MSSLPPSDESKGDLKHLINRSLEIRAEDGWSQCVVPNISPPTFVDAGTITHTRYTKAQGNLSMDIYHLQTMQGQI